jgi:hypothetical protein
MSFRISSGESDGVASAPSTSSGLCAVAIIVPSGRNSTLTLTPAIAAALKSRLASDCVNLARRADMLVVSLKRPFPKELAGKLPRGNKRGHKRRTNYFSPVRHSF